VITTLPWPRKQSDQTRRVWCWIVTKKDVKEMEQLFMEMQRLADQAIHTFSNMETVKLMIDSAEQKCSLYYL